MAAPTLTAVCCDTATQTMWLLMGTAMIVGGLLYARVLIRRLLTPHR